jgi:Tfp pilus assembly protein PilN
MKAVNLLPREAQRSFSTVRGLNPGTNALFGVLAILVVLAAGYVVLANSVTSKRAELAKTQQLQAAAERQVAKLKPYSDLEDLRQSLLGKVRELAGSRFDWPRTIDRVVRAFPADANLTGFEGAAANEGGAPTVTLTGCTPSHDAVARLIDRLRAANGVAGVSLSSSTLTKNEAGAGSGACPHQEQFELAVQMVAPTAAATPAATGTAAAPSATTAAPAPTSTTPAPATGGTP